MKAALLARSWRGHGAVMAGLMALIHSRLWCGLGAHCVLGLSACCGLRAAG